MNIVLRTAEGNIVVRPDTTWEKDNEDFFPPEFVDSISFTPVLFARVLKPGRSIGRKFASRYYDAVNFGVLLYPENMMDGSPESFAAASCIDHMSFLPVPLFNPVTIGPEDNSFELYKNGSQIFSLGCGKSVEGKPSISIDTIEEMVVDATKRIYIRTGDFLAIELDSRKPLVTRADGSACVTGEWCSQKIIDFNIQF